MAFGTLLSLQNTLENCILQDHFHIFRADDEEKQPVKILLQNIGILQKFLENFPRKAEKYEAEINDSAHEVESMVEYFVSDTISEGMVGDVEKEKRLIRDIKEVSAKMESIAQEAVMMESGNKTNTEGDDSLSVKPPSKVEFKISEKVKLVGLDDYIKKLTDDITSHRRELSIIPITGMPGIGKTTLAKAVFDRLSVARHRFDICRWLTISQDYNPRATLLSLLGDGTPYDAMDLVDLRSEVHKMLKKRRYLIAVDDVWSSNDWDNIMISLPDDLNGSRILLTTRDDNVADYVISDNTIYTLEVMDMENSWRLLEQRVFGDEGCCPLELVDIGKTIAKGCKGLPLAIVVVAGILSHIEQTLDAWKSIANDVNGALITDDEQFTEILALSYYHLPTHLKPCFLYFAAFPEDYEIDVSNLCMLWVSEGFLNAGKSNSTEDVEEIAYGWVEDLVNRNLVMRSVIEYNGRIKRCKIHDLMRDLCIRKAGEVKFLNHVGGINVEDIMNARRVSFTSDISPLVMNAYYTSSIHTALCFRHCDHFMSSLHCHRLLRVMDAVAIVLDKFPTQVLQLYHLRYLAISYDDSYARLEVPAEVNKLVHLETLIIKRKGHYGPWVNVPSAIFRMRNLRHLDIESLFCYPDSIGSSFFLENLKTLWGVYNIKFEQHTVESIASVRKLCVRCHLNHNEKWSDYFLHNIRHLGYLETLSFFVPYEWYDTEWCKQNPFLGCIVFPPSLKKLTILGCAARIPWEDMSRVIGSLPNLELLKLLRYVCCGDVWESKEGEFANLRVLEIEGSDLKCWKTENDRTHFPNLEILIIDFCRKLIDVPDCIGDIATLRKIVLNYNHESVSEWASGIEKVQHDNGNDILVILDGRLGSTHGTIGEIFNGNERLSPEELAERCAVYAGDNEDKRQFAENLGITYLMSSEFDVGGSDQLKTQIKTFSKCFDKRRQQMG